MAAEEPGDSARQHAIAEPVAGPVGVGIGTVVDAIADHHVEVARHQRIDHRAHAVEVVGGVAVDHHVHVGLDVREHAPRDIALAGQRHVRDPRAVGPRHTGGVVGGVVVEHVDLRLGQHIPKLGDHLRDGERLVEAGNDRGDAQRRDRRVGRDGRSRGAARGCGLRRRRQG